MYDLQSLLARHQAKARLKYIYFWGHQPQANGEITASCFSQWWQASFVVDDTTYATAEHYMMAQKAMLFNDHAAFVKILEASHPKQAKDFGRQVINFDEKTWHDKRFDIVVDGNLAKFQQHKELSQYLLNTGDRVLVEASPIDKIWGVGLAKDDERILDLNKWRGPNLLGFALMKVRDKLANVSESFSVK